jgi:uncharacterized protein YndB with AHSA1/START domain
MKTFPLLTLVGLLLCGCTTVRQLRDPKEIAADGVPQRTRAEKALDYSVAIDIAAPPDKVWGLLSDAPQFTKWNSTVTKLDGSIALGEMIHLVSIDAPDKTFDLKVTTLDKPTHMVWEDGGSMFLGVRNFTLIATDTGTRFVMSETFSGGMLGMIEGSLPDFTKSFGKFAADLKTAAEK